MASFGDAHSSYGVSHGAIPGRKVVKIRFLQDGEEGSRAMDNRRLLLWLSLAAVVYLMWNAWELEFAKPPAMPAAVTRVAARSSRTSVLPRVSSVPATPQTVPAAVHKHPGGIVRIQTDLYRIRLDLTGVRLRHLDLVHYPKTLAAHSPPVAWFDDHGQRRLFGVVTWVGLQGSVAPGLTGEFKSAQQRYILKSGSRTLMVPLVWTDHGVRIEERWFFYPRSYRIRVESTVDNLSSSPWSGAPLMGLEHARPIVHVSFLGHFLPQNFIYRGAAYYNGRAYHELTHSRIRKKSFTMFQAGGWIAYTNHYFLAALIPPAKTPWHYYARSISRTHYWLGALGPGRRILPGQQVYERVELYVGPKRQRHLGAIAPGLAQTVDYGFLAVLSQPLYLILSWIQQWVGNWGVAIILLVLLIKLLFFPLQHKGGRSMARIQAVQPRIKAIQERFKDDREQSYRATLELFKKEKINPVSGCLPMVIQFPIYIALYWVLLASVELRHAPFMFWIRDLSAPDPLYILPVFYGLTMLVQQRVMPQAATMDKNQRRILMIFLPLVTTLLASVMPSGLVLYWVVSGLFGIGQQWHINRVVMREAAKAHR
jgi:YidC/Oxa1 family membrane protein insertase